ncbi:MAG: transposase, partial [Ethanoligenens sp.]
MRKYDKGFKEAAVKLSDEVGVKQAAVQYPRPVPLPESKRVR